MTKIIAIINQKGGVGKTATACNLAYSLAGNSKSTLLVDLDPSANATHIFFQGSPEVTVKDFILSKESTPFAIRPSFQDDMCVAGLSILPSHISLALAERELANRPFRETLLNKKLREAKIFQDFDYILIDCPPTLTTLTINAIYAADFILIPVTYSKDALEGVADLFEILSEIKEGHTYEIKILRNGYDARKKTVNAFMAEKIKPLIDQGLVLDTVIRQDEAINRSSLENRTVFVHCPHTTAAPDYLMLRNELEDLING